MRIGYAYWIEGERWIIWECGIVTCLGTETGAIELPWLLKVNGGTITGGCVDGWLPGITITFWPDGDDITLYLLTVGGLLMVLLLNTKLCCLWVS
jgi:hypothetical protein